jgi:hypothetical protein
MVLQHIIVFLICFVFPGLVTAMAPASWITFDRTEKGVHSKTYTCAFFVVPFKIQQIDQVVGISHRERSGTTEKQRKFGRTTGKTVEVQGEGFLQIKGADGQFIEVSVSPASLESVVTRSNEFLNSTNQASTTIFTIANWKFGGLMGGTLTMLTLLFVVGYTLQLLKWIFSCITSSVGRADQQ